MPDQDLQTNSDEEILIKDESGSFKLYSHGQLRDYQEIRSRKPAPSALGATSPRPPALKTTLIDTGMEEPMLQPPPPMIRKETASFYFHPEDEEEVAKLESSTVPPNGAGQSKRYSLVKIFNRVMEFYQLTLTDLLKSRLKNIIFSYLRDRRILMDFRDALMRQEIEGGMNFGKDLAERVINFLKEIKEKIEKEGGLVVEETGAVQETGKNSAAAIKTSQPKAIPRLEAEPPLKNIFSSGTVQAKEEIATPKAEGSPTAKTEEKQVFRRPFKKGKMTDVKRDYKLYGPVEELACLDIATFRRLGATTSERAEKVIKKVELLAQESLIKKSTGLQAWRSSPLYKMYLAVGQASMEYNLAIAKIIEQSQQAGKEIITVEEFEAITDINKRLRF